MKSLTDQEVVKRIKSGQIELFSQIVKNHTDRIYNFIAKRIKKKEDVEDLVQEAFLKLYKAIDKFDESRPLLPYLFQIARNEMKMFWRSQKKTVTLDEKIVSEEESEEWIYQHDTERVLKFLTAEERQILESLNEGYSYQDIAGKLNLPLNTIKTKVRRARLKILKLKNEKT